MTDDQKQTIAELSLKVTEASEKYKALAAQNVSSDPDIRRLQSMAFDLAKAELVQARRRLDDAMALL